MSAYSFGKVVCLNPESVELELLRLAAECSIHLKIGIHEDADLGVLQDSTMLAGNGVVFNLFTPGEQDVITLYNEANEAARRALAGRGEAGPLTWRLIQDAVFADAYYAAVATTRFGRFIVNMSNLNGADALGLAIFDNGVDEIIELDATFARVLLNLFGLPWDQGPNALFVGRPRCGQGLATG